MKEQSVSIQQTQRASVADAGDGRAEVYLVVQSEHTDAECGRANQVGNREIGPDRNRNERRRGGEKKDRRPG